MSNYPPGMSGRDFVRAGIDQPHHHEHEWKPAEKEPIFEDGAAIFQEECRYVEGRYAEGFSCEETRTYRFDYDTLELDCGRHIDLPTIQNWGSLIQEIENTVIAIEQAALNEPHNVEMNIRPDRESGEVSIEYKGSTLVYRPQ